MNVLILTPDAVGSTLLQRLLTIYMQFHDYDRPVINLHELTNGLEKYFSPEFGREIVSKSRVKAWGAGYYQSLDQIIELLSSVDHYKTSRLAQYHIKRRSDSLEQQVPFYRYLDENFFVISCRRHNVFEHALSMSVNSITRKLNVYSHVEKFNTFQKMYMNTIKIDERVFKKQLDDYKDYLDWSANYFNISSFFYYDQHLSNMEKYIMNLPIWPNGQPVVSWQDKFGLSLNDWNRCHHIPSDFINLSNVEIMKQLCQQDQDLVTDTSVELYQKHALADWPAVFCKEDFNQLPADMKEQIQVLKQFNIETVISALPPAVSEFLQRNLQGYKNAQEAIKRMQDLDIIHTPPPIKKHTLEEKLAMINNADQCLDLYNNWVELNPGVASSINQQDLDQQIQKERLFWTSFSCSDVSSSQPIAPSLNYQN